MTDGLMIMYFWVLYISKDDEYLTYWKYLKLTHTSKQLKTFFFPSASSTLSIRSPVHKSMLFELHWMFVVDHQPVAGSHTQAQTCCDNFDNKPNSPEFHSRCTALNGQTSQDFYCFYLNYYFVCLGCYRAAAAAANRKEVNNESMGKNVSYRSTGKCSRTIHHKHSGFRLWPVGTNCGCNEPK